MRDDDPCPHSDGHDDCGYYWTYHTGDDDRMSQARNMGRQLGRHFTNESCSAGLIVYAETSFFRCDRRCSSGKAETTTSPMRGGSILHAAETGRGGHEKNVEGNGLLRRSTR